MASSSEHAGAQLAEIAAQQKSLATAVASGGLWMDADVAERAAARCHQAVAEIDNWLYDARELSTRCKFGENADGTAAAERFAEAGQEFINTMRQAQQVFRNMEATYRAAGRTAIEKESANEQMFHGRSQ
jgi:hypothetical protein